MSIHNCFFHWMGLFVTCATPKSHGSNNRFMICLSLILAVLELILMLSRSFSPCFIHFTTSHAGVASMDHLGIALVGSKGPQLRQLWQWLQIQGKTHGLRQLPCHPRGYWPNISSYSKMIWVENSKHLHFRYIYIYKYSKFHRFVPPKWLSFTEKWMAGWLGLESWRPSQVSFKRSDFAWYQIWTYGTAYIRTNPK